jgi:hypothetical protein
MPTSRRSFRWLSRKNGDGGAAKKPKATQVLNDACTLQQRLIAPLPERPKPEASVATSRSQSSAGDKSPSLSSPPAPSAAHGRSPSSSTTSPSRAASTSTSQNVQHGRRQDGTSLDTNAAKKDYWHLAVEKLQEKDPSVADQIAGVSTTSNFSRWYATPPLARVAKGPVVTSLALTMPTSLGCLICGLTLVSSLKLLLPSQPKCALAGIFLVIV